MKLSNPKIKAALVDVPGAVAALLALGWAQEQEPEEAMVVPKGRHFSMAEVGPPLRPVPTRSVKLLCCPGSDKGCLSALGESHKS